MSNIIKLLPDSVANQIAAGEVVQRPASVVKELVENAVDAGSTCIKVIIKDAGKALIQVIDNGCGMSEMDARMSFERHATSKIIQADDLFAIRTKGFRGEALASIAAIAQVELRTKQTNSELGTAITIAGSKFENQEVVSCPCGSNFIVKNLFYNVPARRKFLKSTGTEMRHIVNEFERVALAHPEIEFQLTHNDTNIFILPSGNLRQRIIAISGKQLNNALVPINTDTPLIKLTGFIGKPEASRKTMGDQFFFVNNRFIRHPYLHKAITEGYDNLISHDSIPIYFIYMDVDPQMIDINIHPTKTEIKFEDERSIWHILNAAIRESLGKFNFVPSIDFDTADIINIPSGSDPEEEYQEPAIEINQEYNPFNTEKSATPYGYSKSSAPAGWDQLYNGFENETFTSKMFDQENSEPINEDTPVQQSLLTSTNSFETINSNRFFQFKNKYIITSVKSGMMLIHQKRAHERILFERFINQIKNHKIASQKLLFPEILTFKSEDAILLSELIDDLQAVGIDIDENEDGDFVIEALPSDIENIDVRSMLETIINNQKQSEQNINTETKERIAQTLASKASINMGKQLSNIEMQELFDQLFACSAPNYSPTGKPVITILENTDIDSLF
ncbi:MAG: DNA mismatch repair endonuclease MutL [Marinilabiliaceae bacterium]|nr:DNA mismatch repair endonuclease MutL [Marinilabiliaceae bacterium]